MNPIYLEKVENRIHVLFPLHQEQNVIPDLFHRISNLVVGTPNNTIFYLLTSDRENSDIVKETTYSCLKKFIWPVRVIILNSPKKLYGKGAILNFGLENIEFKPDDWIGVYDSDSDPEKGVFSEVLNNQQFDIIQQPSLYLRNFYSLSKLMQMMASFQTIWCWGSEIQRYKKFSKEIGSKSWIVRYPYLYPVSHGFFIKQKKLVELGNFFNSYEDLRMGIPIVMKEMKLGVSNFYDSCNFANNLTIWIKQTNNWMNGSWFILKDFKKLWQSAENRTMKTKVLLLTIKGVISNLLWAFEGILFITCFLIGLSFGTLLQKVLSSILYILICSFYGPLLFHNIKSFFLNPIDHKDNGIRIFFYATIGPIIRSLGPLICSIRLLLHFKLSEKKSYQVTPKGPF